MESGLFVEAGRRAHVVLRQDGAYSDERERSTEIVNPPGGGSQGIWVEPWRVADGLDVSVRLPEATQPPRPSGASRRERSDAPRMEPLAGFAVAYARRDGVSTISHRLPGYPELTLVKRVWVPLHLPAVVIDLEARNEGPLGRVLGLRCTTRARLSLGWPLGTSEPPVLHAAQAGLHAENTLGHATIVCDPPPGSWTIHADRADWEVALTCSSGEATRLRVIVAAGAADPSGVAHKVLRRADELLRLRVDHYRRCAASAPRLTTPNQELDRAFAACRPALEDFKHDDPEIGLGHFAGFPAYNFYFAGDAFRMLYGACALGDFSDAREALRTIVRGQRQADDGQGQFAGELWHELSTTGHQISPNFVTLELPSILAHYARWSGDLDFARELLPAALRAGGWAARKDANADGLPDNAPEQTFADGVREDLNVAGAHLTPALWQLRAHAALAELCTLLGETSQARAWRRRAIRTRRLVESTFWDRDQAHFVETIRPDGVPDTGPGFVPAFEPRDEVDVQLRGASLRLELDEERALREGRPGAAASFPPEARQARAYYAMDRGDRARRLLEGGFADDGAAALRSIARLPFASTQAGFFPEIASRTAEVADARGCFHQGWTAGYGLAYPVLAGLWGLRPDAGRGRVEVAPTPPADWDAMRLDNVRFGRAELSLVWRRLPADRGAELLVECRGSGLQLEVWLACPTRARRARAVVDARGGRGENRRARRRHDLGIDRIGVRLSLGADGSARVEARWSGPHPARAARPAVGNVRHTNPRDGTFARRVRHTAAGDATPQVVYLGFLAPPFGGLRLHHVPLNYAARRPAALLDVLPTARALVVTDQQDAPLTHALATAIRRFVAEQGGSLLFFCYWSAAWGRGFFDTYCSIAASALPDLLPLAFRRSAVQTTTRLGLHGPGQALWADLPWASAPAIDYQPARLREGAVAWATADPSNEVLAASWSVGAGQVVALGLDAFGFGHGTLVHWPGQRPLLARALDFVCSPPGPPR